MGLIGRILSWLVFATILCVGNMGIAWTAMPDSVAADTALSTGLAYPARVTFAFEYQGRPFQVSFVTVMSARRCGDAFRCHVEWLPGRYSMSIPLPDGSLLVLRPEWPPSWNDDFLRNSSVLTPGVFWTWLNRASGATQIVSGDRRRHLSPERVGDVPFPWFVVQAKIERVSQALLTEAATHDHSLVDADPILSSSNWFRPAAVKQDAQLFAGIDIRPLAAKAPPELKNSSDWIDLNDGCRILFRSAKRPSGYNPGTVDWAHSRALLKEGDVWSADSGPAPTEANLWYPAGRPNPARVGDLFALVKPILSQIRKIEHGGKICKLPAWPDDNDGAYLDFGDNQLFLVIPSLTWAIVQD